MSELHVIRLRGPWEYEPLARSVRREEGTVGETAIDLPPPGRIQMPADWGGTLGAEFRGRVRYRRRFGRPTGLTPHERVWLVLEGVDAMGDVFFGGMRLGQVHAASGAARFDITALVQERNELVVEVELPLMDAAQEAAVRPGRQNLPGGLFGEVRLEIDET